MADSGGGGSSLLVLLVLLGALGGGGYWNYQRNVALENAEVRPYASLSSGDLALLLAATEAEIEALRGAHEQASARSAPAGDGSGRWSDFEATQRHGRAVRDLGARVSGHEGAIAEMRRELKRREGEGDEIRVLLGRVFGF